MNVAPPKATPPPAARPSPDDSPGVPGFRTWRGVYIFVFAAFVLGIVALTWFSRVFA